MFSYSSNEETYHGEFMSRAGAEAEARAEGLTRFWTGENREPQIHLGCLTADSVIEDILNNEDDFLFEAAEDWPDATAEQKAELTRQLQDVFRAWLKRNNLEPTFWIVENVQAHGEE
jgi:hypothetical protein